MINANHLQSGSVLIMDELESVHGDVDIWFDPSRNLIDFDAFSGNACVTDNISDADRETILKAMQQSWDDLNQATQTFLDMCRERKEEAA